MKKPFLTYLFVGLSILAFVLMEFYGSSQNAAILLFFGAKENSLISAGQWWRLITPMFLHIGFFHLIVNMLSVYYLGSDLERLYGHFRFGLIYLLSGLLGNIASFAFNPSISAGASTSIFGLFATVIVLAKSNPNHRGLQHMASSYRSLIIINILFNLFGSGVDIAGHLGGLVGGYLIAVAVSEPSKESRGWGHALIYLGLIIGGLYIGFSKYGTI